MGDRFTYLLLVAVKGVSRLFYDVRTEWVGDVPEDPWSDVRMVAILNHTSLFEPVLAGGVPNRLLRDVARRGVVPVARKTASRPLVGKFFRSVAGDVVSVTRDRDHTWERFLAKATQPGTMAILLPEGRMKRRHGFDKHGEPMTIRGGVADLIRSIPEGRMLLAYSGGLHHVHAPGDPYPRLFRTVRMCLELLEISEYRRERLREAGGEDDFKATVIRDFTRRRDTHCPMTPETDPAARTADEEAAAVPRGRGSGREERSPSRKSEPGAR